MNYRNILSRLALTLTVLFTSLLPSSVSVNNYVENREKIVRAHTEQIRYAQESLEKRFPDHVQFYEDCTGYEVESPPIPVIFSADKTGAAYVGPTHIIGRVFSKKGDGVILISYNLTYDDGTGDKKNFQDVDTRYLLRSNPSKSVEKGVAIHELEHHEEAVSNPNDYYFSDEMALKEGRAQYTEIKCMEGGDAQDREYAQRRHAALMATYEKYVKPFLERCDRFSGMFCNEANTLNREVPYRQEGVPELDRARLDHPLGYYVVYNYVNALVANGMNWREAVEMSKTAGLNVFNYNR